MNGDSKKSEVVWGTMTQAELDAAYNQSVYAPNLQQVLDRQAANSEIARTHLGTPLRFAYGTAEIEGLDVYPAAQPGAPILIYIHGGTWRFGKARHNAFAAEMLHAHGVNLVVPDFSSVDDHDGDLQPLVDQLRRAVAWVHANAATEFGGDPAQVHLAGFSSGAHLAAVLLTTDWSRHHDLPADVLKSGTVVSGMYEMEPVALSFRREFVNFTPDSIHAFSPIRHLDQVRCPITVIHGSLETPEFQRQARDFHAALTAANLPARIVHGEHYNHFELIETLGHAHGIVGREVLRAIQP